MGTNCACEDNSRCQNEGTLAFLCGKMWFISLIASFQFTVLQQSQMNQNRNILYTIYEINSHHQLPY